MRNVEFYNPTDQQIDRKRKMAQMLMESARQPEQTQVVSGYAVPQSPLAGLAKALQQGLGGVVDHNADQLEQSKQQNAQQTMANALGAYSRSQAGGQTQLQDGNKINWNKTPIDQSAAMYQNILMGNPDTAPIGMQAAMSQMEMQQKIPMELELAREKAKIESQYRAPPSSVQEWQFGQSHPEFLKYQQEEGTKASKVWGDAQQLVAASAAAGNPIDIMTAYSIAKSGLGVGRTMEDGQAAPVPGALDTAKAFKSSEAAGTEVGKQTGEAEAKLQAMTAQYPRLEEVVNELSELSQKATYNLAGRTRDTALREAGLPVGEGATARAEYISKVDNEVLPLLRQTFGAQFTAKEGDTLRNTLGDPNKSPQEKDAVLKSFIAQKASQIQTLQRQTGNQNTPSSGKVINWEDLP